MKYFMEFNQLALGIQWGEHVLYRQAYNGLACHIKNEMVHHPKPVSLLELCKLVQAINSCYWECKAEIAHDTPVTSSRPESRPDLKMDRRVPSTQSKPQGKPTNKLKGTLLENPKALLTLTEVLQWLKKLSQCLAILK